MMSSKNDDAATYCPICRCTFEAIPKADGSCECPQCGTCIKRYVPSREEMDEQRLTIQRWRELILMVADLHQSGYEYARIVPFIVDTPGGGDWTCIIAPATFISPIHGAEIDERSDCFKGTSPPGRQFPYFFGRGWRGHAPHFDSSKNLLSAYPTFAEQCLGSDQEYVDWYQEMLRLTEPDGVIYARSYLDDDDHRPLNPIRVISMEVEREFQVPPPPPGKWM